MCSQLFLRPFCDPSLTRITVNIRGPIGESNDNSVSMKEIVNDEELVDFGQVLVVGIAPTTSTLRT